MNNTPLLKPKSVFYGWIVVACVFVILLLAFGCVYSFATFFESLQLEFNTSRGSISLIFAIAGFIYMSLGAVSGQLADRIGSRWIIAGGVVVIGLALLLASRATTMWQIYIVYSVGIGIGVGFTYVPAVGVVQRWFVRQRGFATGLAVAGIGMGTLCMPMFSALLIHWSDWRTAYLVMSLIVLICGTVAALLIVESPEQLGLATDGDPVNPGAARQMQESITAEANDQNQEISVKAALQTKPFWLLFAGCFSSSLGLFIPFVHMVPFSRDLGLPAATGVMLFSLIGVGSTLGRFLLGGIADRFGRRRSLAGMYAGMAAMFVWWLAADNVWQLAVFAFIFGTCYGGFVALLPAVTADYFSGRNLSGIIGALYTSVAVGSLIGPTLAGLAFDVRQSYTIPIVASIIASLFSVLSAILLTDPGKWRKAYRNSNY